MTRIRVVVTAEDIADAGPGAQVVNGDMCPLARALRRRGYAAWVGFGTWTDENEDHQTEYALSPKAQEFVWDYCQAPVQPATFYLEGPDR